MENDPIKAKNVVRTIADSVDVIAYAFDKDRTVIFANDTAKKSASLTQGQGFGAAEKEHFKYNHYFDEFGQRLDYPRGSAIERALAGKETRDLLIERRNLTQRTHQWLQISCAPISDEQGQFQFGVIWYRDVTEQMGQKEKLRFLLESEKILSLQSKFEDRVQEKARLVVPSLADICEVHYLSDDGQIVPVALAHRDETTRAWLSKFRERQIEEGTQGTVNRVIKSGKPEFVPYVSEEMIETDPRVPDSERDALKMIQLNSFMSIPIKTSNGLVLGAYTVAYAGSGRTYSQSDLRFFEEYCAHLAVTFENARLYRELAERDKAKDAFLTSLSHELRNPLAPIKSSLEIVNLNNKDISLTADLKVIDHQFDHMSRLLNDLLDTTRLIQGKITLDKKQENISQIVRNIAGALKPVANERGIQLTVRDPTESSSACVDRTRIEQALSNIISNAIKFTPRGGRVDTEIGGDERNVSVKIKDTGAGITSDEMKYIFEPYYQGERMRLGNSGLGVGLRLVHEIVRLHGGTIEAHSAGEGKGSEFTVKLLRSTPADQQREDTEVGVHEASSRTILVVDDNKPATDSLVRLLKALGWKAHGVYSAAEALEYLATREVSLVFLDIGMPNMNGYELVTLLRKNGQTLLPIVAVTGYGLEDDRRRALEAGFTAHLTKPIGVRDINKVLAEVA